MKRFNEHVRTCQQCKASAAGYCPEGARILVNETMRVGLADVARAQRAEVRRSGAKRFPKGPPR